MSCREDSIHITVLIALQPTSIQLLLIPCPCVPESWDVAVDRIQFFLHFHVPGTLEGAKDIGIFPSVTEHSCLC